MSNESKVGKVIGSDGISRVCTSITEVLTAVGNRDVTWKIELKDKVTQLPFAPTHLWDALEAGRIVAIQIGDGKKKNVIIDSVVVSDRGVISLSCSAVDASSYERKA